MNCIICNQITEKQTCSPKCRMAYARSRRGMAQPIPGLRPSFHENKEITATPVAITNEVPENTGFYKTDNRVKTSPNEAQPKPAQPNAAEPDEDFKRDARERGLGDYYVFDSTVYTRNCIQCEGIFKTSLNFLKYCSVNCKNHALRRGI